MEHLNPKNRIQVGKLKVQINSPKIELGMHMTYNKFFHYRRKQVVEMFFLPNYTHFGFIFKSSLYIKDFLFQKTYQVIISI